MRRFLKQLLILATAALCMTSAFAQTTSRYLIANDNNANGNFATFFTIGADGNFTSHTKVVTGGLGAVENGGARGVAPQVAAFHSKNQDCFFVSEGGSSDIAAIDASLKLVGNFHGGPLDFGASDGIALAINRDFLYAAFSGTFYNGDDIKGSIASFRIQPSCQLEYLGSVTVAGLSQRGFFAYPTGLAAHVRILVVAYGDGSIESFHFSNGRAKSNGDLQYSTGFSSQACPMSVDITEDGQFAIFGDVGCGVSTAAIVEVANVSSGKLSQPATVYNLGTNLPSSYVRLSPDESLLYLSFFFADAGGRASRVLADTATPSGNPNVAAAFFDKTTGAVTLGCSLSLKGALTEWWTAANVASANNGTGTSATFYVPENSFPGEGMDEYVATINLKSNGKTCSLAESKKPHFELQDNNVDFGTVASWPPRAF